MSETYYDFGNFWSERKVECSLLRNRKHSNTFDKIEYIWLGHVVGLWELKFKAQRCCLVVASSSVKHVLCWLTYCLNFVRFIKYLQTNLNHFYENFTRPLTSGLHLWFVTSRQNLIVWFFLVLYTFWSSTNVYRHIAPSSKFF